MGRVCSGLFWGLAFIAVGLLMLLDRLGVIYFDFGNFISVWWPLILVIVGLNMVLNNRAHRSRRARTED